MNENQTITEEIKKELVEWKNAIDVLNQTYKDLDVFVSKYENGRIPDDEYLKYKELDRKFKSSLQSFIRKCKEIVNNSEELDKLTD